MPQKKERINNMKADLENNIFTVDLGYISKDVKTGEIYRAGEERLTVAKVVLPELEGSEKQIAWANEIIANKLYSMFESIESAGVEKLMTAGKVNSLQEVAELMLKNNRNFNWILTTTKASEVIARR